MSKPKKKKPETVDLKTMQDLTENFRKVFGEMAKAAVEDKADALCFLSGGAALFLLDVLEFTELNIADFVNFVNRKRTAKEPKPNPENN